MKSYFLLKKSNYFGQLYLIAVVLKLAYSGFSIF